TRSPGPERIHELRTTTRRIRVLLRLFAEELPFGARELGRELRWFARRLGRLRDLDVWQARLPQRIDGFADSSRAALVSYQRRVRSERTKAHRALLPLFESKRVARLMSACEHWLPRVPPEVVAAPRARERLTHYVHASVERVLDRGRKIRLQ